MRMKNYYRILLQVALLCFTLTAALTCFGQLTLKWKVKTGAAVSGSPALSPDGKTVYITSEDGMLYALDVSRSGAEKFGPLQIGNISPNGEPVSSPVVTANGSIYVASSDGHLYCIAADGSTNWMLDLGVGNSHGGSSVAVGADGTIYVTYDDLPTVFAVDPTYGTNKWEFDTTAPPLNTPGSSGYGVDSSPTVGPNGTIYFIVASAYPNGSDDSKLVALDCAGTFKWFLNSDTSRLDIDSDFYFDPVLDSQGAIYCPMDLAGQNQNYASGSWLLPVNGNSSPLWTGPYVAGGTIQSSPAIGPDGTVYFGCNDDNLYALDSNGNLKWKHQAPDMIESSPALASNGTIYFGCNDGNLYAIAAENGSLVDTYTTTASYHVRSSPAIGSDGTVYFGSDDGYVYALSGTAPLANSAWPMFRRNPAHTASMATGSCGCVGAPTWSPNQATSFTFTPCSSSSFVPLSVSAPGASAVDFYAIFNGSDVLIGSKTPDAYGNATFDWYGPPPGSTTLYATAVGGGCTATSGPLTITVNCTGCTVSPPTWLSPSSQNQSFTIAPWLCTPGITLTVSAPDADSVEFYNGLQDLGPGTADNGYFNFAWANPPLGNSTLSAVASRAGCNSATSESIQIVVTTSDCISVQFGPSGCVQQTGLAATGVGSQDYWNVISGLSGGLTANAFPCQDVHGKCTSVSLEVDDSSGSYQGSWSLSGAYPLFNYGLTSGYGQDVLLTIYGLPAGSYDVYLYGLGPYSDFGCGAQYLNTQFTIEDGPDNLPPSPLATYPSGNFTSFSDGDQYVVFPGLQFSTSGNALVIDVSDSSSCQDYEDLVINGLQIVPSQ